MEIIGDIIKKKLNEKGIKVTDFTDAINCDRINAYSIFKRSNIDMELLTKISKILDYDFLTEYQNNNLKYFVAIEVDDLKMKEIESDLLIKILYTKNV